MVLFLVFRFNPLRQTLNRANLRIFFQLNKFLLNYLFARAAKLGLIPRSDFNYAADDLGVAGSRTANNRYLSNPSLFTDLELETTVANLRTLTAQQ